MLRFTVYDRTRARKGYVQAVPGSRKPVMHSAKATPRHNVRSSAEFVVDADHLQVEHLATPGARCRVEYRFPSGWGTLFTGAVRQAQGGSQPATRTFSVDDDKAVLWQLLGWPVPAAPIGAQTETHWTLRGPAETVLKRLVAANASRSYHPIVVAPDRGRGAVISVSVRFLPLADVLLPQLDQAGLGVTVEQAEDGSGLVVDVYEKRVHAVALTDRAGVITGETSYTIAAPTATRVVVGAGGEGEARLFREYIDHARETEWGMAAAVFKDARDIKASLAEQPDRDTLMKDRADEVLREGGPTASLSMQLAETKHFRFGRHGDTAAVWLGDIVKASVAGGPELTDTVREVPITQTADGGVLVTPVVGDRASDPDNPDALLDKYVAAAMRGLRTLTTGR